MKSAFLLIKEYYQYALLDKNKIDLRVWLAVYSVNDDDDDDLKKQVIWRN